MKHEMFWGIIGESRSEKYSLGDYFFYLIIYALIFIGICSLWNLVLPFSKYNGANIILSILTSAVLMTEYEFKRRKKNNKNFKKV